MLVIILMTPEHLFQLLKRVQQIRRCCYQTGVGVDLFVGVMAVHFANHNTALVCDEVVPCLSYPRSWSVFGVHKDVQKS